MRLDEHPFFDGLEPVNIAELCTTIEVVDFAENTEIFSQNSPSENLYLLLEGEVAFRKQVSGKTYRTVSLGHPGEFFGEIGLFTGEPRSTQAWANLHSKIAEIPREKLLGFIRNHPVLVERILQSIIRHLHETTDHYMKDILRQEKMAMVGNMVNSIIHDFRNPFTTLRMGIGVIGQLHKDNATQDLCRMLEDQVTNMTGMIEELHMFSRGEQTVKFTTVNLPRLLERFQELNRPFFEKDRLDITVDVADLDFEADEDKILRVLQNLVGNAIEALGEQRGEIHICGERAGEHLQLIVRDTSGGIPEKIRRHLFDPFVTFGKNHGTGLGTAIVKSIVEAHSGIVTFETEDNVGTTFFVRVPLRQESPATADLRQSPRIESNYTKSSTSSRLS